MIQFNYLVLIAIFLLYFIILCIRKRISLFSTFFTLAYGVAIYFSLASKMEPYDTGLSSLFFITDITIFFGLLFMIIFCRSLYKDKKENKKKAKKVKEKKTKNVKEEPVVEEKPVEVIPAQVIVEPENPMKNDEPLFKDVEEVKEEPIVEEKPVEVIPAQVIVEPEKPMENDEPLFKDVEEDKEVSLKESIQLAKQEETPLSINKQVVYDYLAKYADVELNTRKNLTATGLPLADTHYRLVGDGKVCFAYVYEIEGKSFMILRLPNKEAINGFIKKYGLKKSAFPKQVFDWYTVILSSKFKTNEEVFALLDEAYNQVEN